MGQAVAFHERADCAGAGRGSWRTETLLSFRLAHARARDAVGKVFAVEALEAQLREAGWETVRLATAASSSAVFLKRPDLGRRLAEDSQHWLTEHAGEWAERDLAVIVSDGLSALAAERQVVPTLAALLPLLEGAGWRVGPILVVPFARGEVAGWSWGVPASATHAGAARGAAGAGIAGQSGGLSDSPAGAGENGCGPELRVEHPDGRVSAEGGGSEAGTIADGISQAGVQRRSAEGAEAAGEAVGWSLLNRLLKY